MLDKDGLARLIDYTIWANHRVMRACATIPPDDFRREMGASHGSLRGTLAHTMWAEWIWLERWKGNSPSRMPDESELADVIALRDRWTVIEEHRRLWLDALAPSSPTASISYKTMAGVAHTQPLWQLVQHVANHSTYHRGQATSLLRQVGGRTVPTDMMLWDREQDTKA